MSQCDCVYDIAGKSVCTRLIQARLNTIVLPETQHEGKGLQHTKHPSNEEILASPGPWGWVLGCP